MRPSIPPVGSISAALSRAGKIIRRVIGAPDYDTYLAHMHAVHPEKEPLPREHFERERLNDRYARPGSRCC